MKRLLVVAASIAMLAAGVGWSFAGEVKGPPGTYNNTDYTGAPDNANSNCAYSGLNDLDQSDPMGQLTSQVQTAADSWKIYQIPVRGAEGQWGLCKGGTNGDRTR